MTGHSCNQMKLYGHGNLNFISSSFIVRGYFLFIIEFLKKYKTKQNRLQPQRPWIQSPIWVLLGENKHLFIPDRSSTQTKEMILSKSNLVD